MSKITKIICWIYLVLFILVTTFTVGYLGLHWRFLWHFHPLLDVATPVFGIMVLLLLVFGSIFSFKKPRSRFVMTITILNYLLIAFVIIILAWVAQRGDLFPFL